MRGIRYLDNTVKIISLYLYCMNSHFSSCSTTSSRATLNGPVVNIENGPLLNISYCKVSLGFMDQSYNCYGKTLNMIIIISLHMYIGNIKKFPKLFFVLIVVFLLLEHNITILVSLYYIILCYIYVYYY